MKDAALSLVLTVDEECCVVALYTLVGVLLSKQEVDMENIPRLVTISVKNLRVFCMKTPTVNDW